MAYIGRSIEYGNAVADHFTGNGGATYTLSYDTVTNGVVVSLDGVVQKNGTDFNITGTSLVFTSVVASPIAIQVIYTGLTLTYPVPSDNSVSGSKIAMGSDAQGDTLYYNGTDYARLAKGTAGQALVMNSGATAPEWGSAGGPSLGTDAVIRTNAKTIAENITFAGTENGMSAGPITINSSYTVTVTSGSTWTVVGA
jgi:hypothetical protein